MEKLVLFQDMDGPLVDLHAPWFDMYNKDYGDDLSANKITEWGVHKFVKFECGMRIYKYLQTPGLFSSAKPVPGAIDALKELHNSGDVDIYFLTDPLDIGSAYQEKIEWVRRYLPFIEGRRVIASPVKHLFKGHILHDDCGDHLTNFDGIRIAWDAPYNRGITVDYRLDQPSSRERWEFFVQVVKGLLSNEDYPRNYIVPSLTDKNSVPRTLLRGGKTCSKVE